jgi:hypothetical protein
MNPSSARLEVVHAITENSLPCTEWSGIFGASKNPLDGRLLFLRKTEGSNAK